MESLQICFHFLKRILLDRFVCLEHVDRLGETHLASKRFFEGKKLRLRLPAYLHALATGGLAASLEST